MPPEEQLDLQSLITHISLSEIVKMFDLLPNTLFWIKDKESRFIHANVNFIEHIGVKSLEQMLGKSDLAFSPKHLARQYMIDDQKVMQGQSITNRLELNMLKGGGYGWFATSKRPFHDEQGEIKGSYGFTQYLDETSTLLSNINEIKTAVKYIRENYGREITIEKLASISFLSVSALERRFKKQLSKTPKQFINQVRLENARRLIMETDSPIADIADACGFREHSYFSKQFKTMFEVQPSLLRQQAK